MFRYVLKRLVQMVPLLVLISMITFGISKLAPGDHLSARMADPSMTAERIDAERKRLGLDKPVPVQYVKWASAFATGDMGESYRYRTSVSSLIVQRMGATLLLGAAAMVLTWLLAIPLGIYAAVNKYSLPDKIFSTLTFTALGIPEFFLVLLLMFLAAKTGWLPVGSMTSADFASLTAWGKVKDLAVHLVLPTIAVTIGTIAILQRRMRGNLLDVLAEDYVRMARAKGLPENRVIYKHAVRNALNPMITILGYDIAGLLSGFALVEIIVAWPGLGQMMLEALQSYDMPLAMAGMMIGAVMLLLGNLLSDVLLAMVDPRIKLEA
ncbi:MAG: ABC transporter permease [Candidatus Sericytochromatia bacterium]|nr:ABC transporter permease [Candidatus Sericytochromatia bacterium]